MCHTGFILLCEILHWCFHFATFKNLWRLLLEGQGFEKCLRTWRISGRIGSFSLFLLALHAQLSVLQLHYDPKLFDSVMYCSWCRRKTVLRLPWSWISMSDILYSTGKEAQSYGNSLGCLLIAITECVHRCDLLQEISWHRLSHISLFFKVNIILVFRLHKGKQKMKESGKIRELSVTEVSFLISFFSWHLFLSYSSISSEREIMFTSKATSCSINNSEP